MKPTADPPKTPDSKDDAKPDAKGDLKAMPIAEMEKKTDLVAGRPHASRGAKTPGPVWPQRNRGKESQSDPEVPQLLLGPHSMDDRDCGDSLGRGRSTDPFLHYPVLLVANGVIGFWEERQAGNAIAALKAKLAIKARVKRDGKWINPPARELVPGDAIRLRLGDIVPADARLLAGDPVQVDESALTGESLPATRKPGEAVFSGSIVRRGEIGALVYATGTNTYFGKTAMLVETAHTVSHFQRAVLKIGNYLILLAAVLVAMIIGVAIFRGDEILTTLQFALVLTVAAIPVAMPTVLSVTMAVGARLLAKKQAIVSKLVAIEELAGVDVLCADKTGTLTQNKLTLGEPFSVNKIPGRASDPRGRARFARGRQRHDRPRGPGGAEGRRGAEGLQGRSFPTVRSGAQAHRGLGRGSGWKSVQGDERRAAGHPRVGGELGEGEARRRQGGERICGARLSRVGRGASRCRWKVAIPGRAAAVRSAAGRCRKPSLPRKRWA